MVTINNIDMPKACTEYHEDTDSVLPCPLYNSCEYRSTVKTNYKPIECPLEISSSDKADDKNLSESDDYKLMLTRFVGALLASMLFVKLFLADTSNFQSFSVSVVIIALFIYTCLISGAFVMVDRISRKRKEKKDAKER